MCGEYNKKGEKMELKFKELPKKKAERKKIKKLYQKAFPRDERLPFWMLKIKAKSEGNLFYSIYDEDKFVGIVYLIIKDGITYVFYLAIDSENRGKGYGSIVLEKIKKEQNPESVILCIEEIDKNAENYEQRVKRKKFYQKSGFEETGYKSKEGKRFYELLIYGKKYDKQKYEEIMKKVWGNKLYSILGIMIEKID